jgi:hypothetical protein
MGHGFSPFKVPVTQWGKMHHLSMAGDQCDGSWDLTWMDIYVKKVFIDPLEPAAGQAHILGGVKLYGHPASFCSPGLIFTLKSMATFWMVDEDSMQAKINQQRRGLKTPVLGIH